MYKFDVILHDYKSSIINRVSTRKVSKYAKKWCRIKMRIWRCTKNVYAVYYTVYQKSNIDFTAKSRFLSKILFFC